MANLFGNLLAGAAVGGASASLEKMKADSAQRRKESYAKILNEYQAENIKLRQGLMSDREDARRKAVVAQDDKKYQLGRQDLEADYIRDRADKAQDRKNKVGTIGQQLQDLKREYGDEKGKAIFESMSKKNDSKKGALTQAQLLKSLDSDREGYNSDVSAQGEQESGHLWWKKEAKPPVAFESWIKKNRPEKYKFYVEAGVFGRRNISGGRSSASGTIEALLGDTTPKKGMSLIETVNHGQEKVVNRSKRSNKDKKRPENSNKKSSKYSDVKIPHGRVSDFNKTARKGIMDKGEFLGKGGLLDRRLQELRKER